MPVPDRMVKRRIEVPLRRLPVVRVERVMSIVLRMSDSLPRSALGSV
jgi:hypothetical protein